LALFKEHLASFREHLAIVQGTFGIIQLTFVIQVELGQLCGFALEELLVALQARGAGEEGVQVYEDLFAKVHQVNNLNCLPPNIRPQCSLTVPSMLPVPSLHVLCMFPVPSLHVPCTFSACSLHVPCMFPEGGLRVVLRDAQEVASARKNVRALERLVAACRVGCAFRPFSAECKVRLADAIWQRVDNDMTFLKKDNKELKLRMYQEVKQNKIPPR
jgi:hypothetical protein